MPVSVTMPRLGESVTEGTVTRWLKQEGERVEADEPLLEVSTDKVDTEIPSPAAGVLARIVVGEDETADVGSELAVIAGDGEEAASSAPAPAQQQAAPPQEAQQQEPEPAAPTTPSMAVQIPAEFGGRQLVTPELVNHAHAHGIQIHVWTINTAEEMAELLDLGVDGIITDFPGRLCELIGQRRKAADG